MATKEPTIEDALIYLKIDDAQKAKDQSQVFDAKKWCWVASEASDSEGYLAAEIKSQSGDMVTVETTGGKTQDVKKDDLGNMNPPKYEKCPDMANLTYLNEASVLYNLKQRYVAGLIYTYSGLFCVAINPYRRLPIYSDAVIKYYRGKRRPEVPPHIFAIVDSAYQDMLVDHENQSMLITGESGAGKTENTKKVINYIAKVAGVENKNVAPPPEAGSGLQGTLDEQVVEANPLLEAFGNAKTTRNNNSSRFGKFIRCHFSQTGKLAGADIESYLLEKNRVIHQGSQERNYHIFYQMLYAMTDEEIAKFCLITREAKEYGFLSKGVSHVDRIDDHEEWGLTINACKVLGFNEEEKDSMLKITAAIMNFSNMKFKQKPRDEQAEVDDPADGERVAYLLGLQVGEFHKSLIKPKVKVGTEYVNKGQSVSQVLYAVAALSKALFERMFLWIVTRVNKALDTKERRSYFIGVLDIAGFEIFDYNSFEQLCINLTNEKLQQFFNHTMFVLEQEEYKKEGIHWEFIDFGMDLEETINLVEKPMGIFAMLEEECIVPKATDQTYLSKMHQEHAKNKAYTKPTPKQSKSGGGDFILHHYAGSVGYSVAGWLEKNKDPINEHTAQLFSKATTALVSQLFQDYNPDKAGARKKGSAFQTVSFRHKEQLKNLMTTLHSTSPHFVRCIIPNEKKQPGLVDGQLVLHQLRCNGVLEGIRICRKGFPSRMLFNDFKQRYQILAASAIPAGFIDGKVAAGKLLEALQLDESEYKLGNTKVFFRSGIVGDLEEMRDERLSKIMSQFQAYCKAILARVEFKKMCDQRVGLAVIQRNVRKFLMLRNWPWWKLYIKVQPLLSVARAEEEMKEKEEELKKAMENAEANEKKRKELEEKVTDLFGEKEKLFGDLQAETERLIATEDRLMETQSIKDKLEASLNEALEKLDGEEHGASILKEKTEKAEAMISELQAKGEELEENISKLESEKTARDKQIETLTADLAQQDEGAAKLSKEKKAVEEHLAERTEQLQASEDKANQLSKAKSKLEGQVKEIEHNLSKEKEAKAKVEKDKKKVEGDLKSTKDKLAETETELASTRETVTKRDKAIKELEEQKEGYENLIKQLQKKIQELLARVEELEEELENERKLRQKTELARKDLESQLEEMQEALEAQGGATHAQVEVAKKREAECARLRKEIDEVNSANDAALSAAKSKFNAALADAQDEAENLKKAKAKSDKERNTLSSELDDVSGQLEHSKKQKAAADKNNRNLEEQVNDLRSQLGDAESNLVDAQGRISKASSEGSNINKLLEEAEHKLGIATKNNKLLESNLADAISQYEDEAKSKHDMNTKLQHAMSEIDALNEQLDDESSAKSQLQNKFAKLNSEFNSIKGKVVEEGAGKLDELEDAKRKLNARVMEMEEALQAANSRAASMEKMKNRMNDEVEDLVLALEKAQVQSSTLEKKQKKVDAQIDEWRMKCDDIQAEMDKAQNDTRNISAEVLRLRHVNEDIEEKNDFLRRENKKITADMISITESMDGGSKNSVEIEKMRRKLQSDNDDLVLALEDTEVRFEAEAAKALKMQLEMSQFRQFYERKLAEKEDEVENGRKNHARQLESMQATIDNELRTKAELHKHRKKFENSIQDLETNLEYATRNYGDAQKAIKKLQAHIKELTAHIDEEERSRDDFKDTITRAERRANDLVSQLDEARIQLEQSDRSRKMAEGEKGDLISRISELESLYSGAANAKRKAEGDYHALHEEIENLENDVRAAEERATKAMNEVARLMNDLNSANENASTADKSRQLLARQIADLQSQLETAEAASGSGLKSTLKRLEMRIMELESELDNEARKGAQIVKQARQADKKLQEALFNLDDSRKNNDRTQTAADALNSKLKKMRIQIEELEMENQSLHSKYKKAAVELEEMQDRNEATEAALLRTRQRTRTTTTTVSSSRIPSAASSRQRSRLRTPMHGD